MNKLKALTLVASFVALFSFALVPAPAGAVDAFLACNDTSVGTDQVCGSKTSNVKTVIRPLVNTLLYILGAVAVVVIILGGLLYSTSAGDASRVTTAKNTILYAVVGLIVALLAYAIVNYVVKTF